MQEDFSSSSAWMMCSDLSQSHQPLENPQPKPLPELGLSEDIPWQRGVGEVSSGEKE